MATSTTALASLRDRLQGAIARQNATSLRQRIEKKSGVIIESAATVAGGAIGGAAFAKWDKLVMGLDADLVIGSTGHLAAMLIGGKYSNLYHSISSGMLAGWASRSATLYMVANARPTSGGGGRPPATGAAGMTARQWAQAFKDV
jgi:hypothetical protein